MFKDTLTVQTTLRLLLSQVVTKLIKFQPFMIYNFNQPLTTLLYMCVYRRGPAVSRCLLTLCILASRDRSSSVPTLCSDTCAPPSGQPGRVLQRGMVHAVADAGAVRARAVRARAARGASLQRRADEQVLRPHTRVRRQQIRAGGRLPRGAAAAHTPARASAGYASLHTPINCCSTQLQHYTLVGPLCSNQANSTVDSS